MKVIQVDDLAAIAAATVAAGEAVGVAVDVHEIQRVVAAIYDGLSGAPAAAAAELAAATVLVKCVRSPVLCDPDRAAVDPAVRELRAVFAFCACAAQARMGDVYLDDASVEDPATAALVRAVESGDAGIEEARSWLRARSRPSVVTIEQLPLDLSISDQPAIRCYVVAALTARTESDRAFLQDVCAQLRKVFDELSIVPHFPHEFTDPIVNGDLAPSHVHSVDMSESLRSDFVVMLADLPSSGSGKELVWCERNRGSILLLELPSLPVSRLVLGSTADPVAEMIADPADVADIVRRFVAEKRPQLERHALERAARPKRYAVTLARMRSILPSVLSAIQSDPSSQLTEARAHEMIIDANHVDNAALGELAAFAQAGGTAVGELLDDLSDRTAPRQPDSTLAVRPAELEALRSAADLRGWDRDTVIDLLVRHTMTPSLSGAKHRRGRRDAESWLELHDDGQ